MRWRVGRRPTCRNMALTSCQGQPVRADRSGDRSVLAFILGITKVRVGVISFTPKKAYPQTGPAKNRFICNIYEIDPTDATASQLKERPICRGFSLRNPWDRHLCPLALVCYQLGHGNSAKPPAWGRSAYGHAPAQLRIRRLAGVRPRGTIRRRQRAIAVASDVDV